MTADELRGYLTQRRVPFEEKFVQHGIQFRCGSGEIFIVFKTGKVSVQGKQSELAEAVRKWSLSGAAPSAVVAEAVRETAAPIMEPDRRGLIEYGHDIAARD